MQFLLSHKRRNLLSIQSHKVRWDGGNLEQLLCDSDASLHLSLIVSQLVVKRDKQCRSGKASEGLH